MIGDQAVEEPEAGNSELQPKRYKSHCLVLKTAARMEDTNQERTTRKSKTEMKTDSAQRLQ